MSTEKRRSYESARCPMTDCSEELYMVVEHSIPVYAETLPGDMEARNAITSGWRVECVAGHVVLLPFGDGCSEESATFVESCDRCAEDGRAHNDYERLRALVDAPLVSGVGGVL